MSASKRKTKPKKSAAPKKATANKKTTKSATKRPSSRVMGGRFVRHDLMCTDPARAAAFYRALFGWETIDLSVMGMTITRLVSNGRVQGAIMPFDPKHGVPSHWIPYISTPDVDATCKRVKALGGIVCMGAMDIPPGRFALCAFPERALFSPFTPKDALPKGDAPIGCFCWDEVHVRDAAAAKKLYAALFGWKAVDRPGSVFTLLKRDGHDVAGVKKLDAGAPTEATSWLAYVNVADLDRTVASIKKLGGEVLVPRSEIPPGWFAVFRDPTRATLGVFEARQH